MNTIRAFCMILTLSLAAAPARAAEWSDVAINGQHLTVAELQALQMQLGAPVAAGSYLVNAAGCWFNLTTGASGCVDRSFRDSRYGSGERSGDGSWNHWSNAAGAGVGGTADGCIYTTTGWSNC